MQIYCLAYLTLKMEATYSSEMPVSFWLTTRRYTLEDITPSDLKYVRISSQLLKDYKISS
jgi:hypothetical protein